MRAKPNPISQPSDIPKDPVLVDFHHPTNDCIFLVLPAYDSVKLDNGGISFGLHHGTALLACKIISYNTNGYLSTSKNRDDQGGRVSATHDNLLTSSVYYYHLDLSSFETHGLNYPICIEFDLWKFPHDNFPSSWNTIPHSKVSNALAVSGWTAISAHIKGRDAARCRISDWLDGIQTAHIIPKEHGKWMKANNMERYIVEATHPLDIHSGNLFALRADLYLSHFDQAGFTIVAKGNQMVVHFLELRRESAALYHNTDFQITDLSLEFLFARFAWSVVKLAKCHTAGERKNFRFVEGKNPEQEMKVEHTSERGGEDRTSKKRKREDEGEDEDEQDKPQGSNIERKTTTANLSNFGGEELLDDLDAREIARDMELAKEAHPFFLTNERANERKYETLAWYPGWSVIERKKRKYLEEHPNIRACSSETACAEDDGSVASDLDF